MRISKLFETQGNIFKPGSRRSNSDSIDGRLRTLSKEGWRRRNDCTLLLLCLSCLHERKQLQQLVGALFYDTQILKEQGFVLTAALLVELVVFILKTFLVYSSSASHGGSNIQTFG